MRSREGRRAARIERRRLRQAEGPRKVRVQVLPPFVAPIRPRTGMWDPDPAEGRDPRGRGISRAVREAIARQQPEGEVIAPVPAPVISRATLAQLASRLLPIRSRQEAQGQ